MGVGACVRGGRPCCHTPGRGTCICPSSLHLPTLPPGPLPPAYSWASRSQSWAQLEPTCRTSFPGRQPFHTQWGFLKPHFIPAACGYPHCPCSARAGSPELHPGSGPDYTSSSGEPSGSQQTPDQSLIGRSSMTAAGVYQGATR